MSYNRDPLTKKTISQPYTQGVTNTSYQSMTHYGLKNQDIIKNQSGNNLRNQSQKKQESPVKQSKILQTNQSNNHYQMQKTLSQQTNKLDEILVIVKQLQASQNDIKVTKSQLDRQSTYQPSPNQKEYLSLAARMDELRRMNVMLQRQNYILANQREKMLENIAREARTPQTEIKTIIVKEQSKQLRPMAAQVTDNLKIENNYSNQMQKMQKEVERMKETMTVEIAKKDAKILQQQKQIKQLIEQKHQTVSMNRVCSKGNLQVDQPESRGEVDKGNIHVDFKHLTQAVSLLFNRELQFDTIKQIADFIVANKEKSGVPSEVLAASNILNCEPQMRSFIIHSVENFIQKPIKKAYLLFKMDSKNKNLLSYIADQQKIPIPNLILLFRAQNSHIFGFYVDIIIDKPTIQHKGCLFSVTNKQVFYPLPDNNRTKNYFSVKLGGMDGQIIFGNDEIKFKGAGPTQLTIKTQTNNKSYYGLENEHRLTLFGEQSDRITIGELQLHRLEVIS